MDHAHEWNATAKVNVTMDEKKHFGVAASHDGKEMASCNVQAAMEDSNDRLFFAKFDAKAI